MVDSLGFLDGTNSTEGVKGACWYTILGNPWLEKLGGVEKQAHGLKKTPEIELLPHSSGFIFRLNKGRCYWKSKTDTARNSAPVDHYQRVTIRVVCSLFPINSMRTAAHCLSGPWCNFLENLKGR
ncbi:DUF3396 domain-containing protein [Citrobacter koseri]|nr:DUF3396 domain-containing protein [Citrobacter koseri]